MNEYFLMQVNARQRVMFTGGIFVLIVCVIGAFFNPQQFFASYLSAYLFWVGLSFGCLCVAMIHHLTGGRWGDVTRRFLEAGYMTLPVMAALFLPLFFGLHHLYSWARPEEVARSEILQHKAHYLNVPGFVARTIFYFVVAIAMAACLRRWSVEQDETRDLTPTRQARTLSGPGVVIYPLIMTFASIDWLMSLEPDWYSTMFPVILCGGQILSTFAFAILVLGDFAEEPPFPDVLEPAHFHQLGNLLLTFVMFWTYVEFGQLLIIWSGNLPHEIVWYLHRIAGGWKWIAGGLALFNFFIPFYLLLFRGTTKSVPAMRFLAGLIFFFQIVNCYWMVEPRFFPGLHIHWLDFATVIGIGGIWLGMFYTALKGAALLPRNDPRISYATAIAK